MLSALKWLAALFTLAVAMELVSGGDPRRYLTRNFRNDLLYGIFYRGGVYVLFVYAPLVSLLKPRYSFALAEQLPFPIRAVVFFLATEFMLYWIHRLQHGNRFFWQFHQIHHAQTTLTYVTQSRFHVIDQLVNHLFVYIPVSLLLGVNSGQGLVLLVITESILALQHADLRWRYGPFERVVVSPAFHGIHHSIQPEHHDRNYGQILTIWDQLFGTAVFAPRPTVFGLKGWTVPQSFVREHLAPFASLVRRPPAETPAETPALAPEAGKVRPQVP